MWSSSHSSSPGPRPSRNPISRMLALPPQLLSNYGDFITANAHQVSQIEGAFRSLTYIIPGRFRDAEMASEGVHSAVQLLSLYHDSVLRRAASSMTYFHNTNGTSTPTSTSPKPMGTGTAVLPKAPPPSPHTRYTRFWTARSSIYRRVALLLQMVQYTELLCEMAAKRRGERMRFHAIVTIEAIKAICKLIMLAITRARPLLSPPMPEREPLPGNPNAMEEEEDEEGNNAALRELMGEYDDVDEETGLRIGSGSANHVKPAHARDWVMPRTGARLPSLPHPGDISSYLLSRVLTADDIKPAARLLNTLQGRAHAAEILNILAPLIYAIWLSRTKDKQRSWAPWLVGVGLQYAARQLRDRSFRATSLEHEEWNRRAWAMAWWALRGPMYDAVVKGVVTGVKRRVPGFVGGIIGDYEYLWENYYFSTCAS